MNKTLILLTLLSLSFNGSLNASAADKVDLKFFCQCIKPGMKSARGLVLHVDPAQEKDFGVVSAEWLLVKKVNDGWALDRTVKLKIANRFTDGFPLLGGWFATSGGSLRAFTTDKS